MVVRKKGLQGGGEEGRGRGGEEGRSRRGGVGIWDGEVGKGRRDGGVAGGSG